MRFGYKGKACPTAPVRLSIALLAILMIGGESQLSAQGFTSGSDGSDGTFFAGGPPGTVVTFNPRQFQGTQVGANIFNFTSITIQAGVTVKLSGTLINGPVYWLSQGDVDINGTLDLSGAVGYGSTPNPFERAPAVPGAGGFPGGVGGNTTTNQAAMMGGGPGGGAAGPSCSNATAGAGTFSGNQFLIPLVGGSGGGGGGGCNNTFGPGGGGGGGAILIASSTQITVRGTINADGGGQGWHWAGGGSGGAIRLTANQIIIPSAAVITALGGNLPGGYGGPPGGPGRIRLEGYSFSVQGSLAGSLSQSSPFPLLLATAGPPMAKVISIGGVAISPNPPAFPDITINTAMPIPVVIQTQNIPTTATVLLTIINQNGVPDTVINAPPVGNCDQSNTCTTTVDVVFPFGASRGLTRVTWTQ